MLGGYHTAHQTVLADDSKEKNIDGDANIGHMTFQDNNHRSHLTGSLHMSDNCWMVATLSLIHI